LSRQFAKRFSYPDTIPDKSTTFDKNREISFSIATILIEISGQQPCFPPGQDLEKNFGTSGLPSFTERKLPIEFLQNSIPEVKKRMGGAYSGLVYQCALAAVSNKKKSRGEIYRKVIFGLQDILRNGFRIAMLAQQTEAASPAPLTSQEIWQQIRRFDTGRGPDFLIAGGQRISSLRDIPYSVDHVPSGLPSGGYGGENAGVPWLLITSFRERGMPTTSTWHG
jgi:hypothetical protein